MADDSKFKKFVNKIIDVPKLIIRLWIVLWAILLILLVMKIIFNIWYPVFSTNQSFNTFCDYLEKNKELKYAINFAFYFASSNITYFIASLQKKYSKWYECIIVNILILTSFIIKIYNNYLAFPFEIMFTIIIPIIVLYRKEIKNKFLLVLYPVIIQLFLILFQLIITFVRGLPNNLNDSSIDVQIIMQTDYYIFLFLTWMGVNFMGLMGVWFWGRDITVLKAEKEKELAKSNPDQKLISEIDKQILELEKQCGK